MTTGSESRRIAIDTKLLLPLKAATQDDHSSSTKAD